MSGVTRLWNQVSRASKDQFSSQVYTCPLSEAFVKTYSMDLVQGPYKELSERRAAWI